MVHMEVDEEIMGIIRRFKDPEWIEKAEEYKKRCKPTVEESLKIVGWL